MSPWGDLEQWITDTLLGGSAQRFSLRRKGSGHGSLYSWPVPAFPSKNEIYQETKRFIQKAQKDSDTFQWTEGYWVRAHAKEGTRALLDFSVQVAPSHLPREQTPTERRCLEVKLSSNAKRRVYRELLELEKEAEVITKAIERKIRGLLKRGVFSEDLKNIGIKRVKKAKKRVRP